MDAHDLFGLPLERFVAERNALAKELRAGGDRDQAAEVAALRKPSEAAWAVNQLVRTQARDVRALFEAGDRARRAQTELLGGRKVGAKLREALDRERAAVSRLVGAARGLLSTEGHELSPVMLERVADTLHAAALDEEARAQVEGGRLQRELRHIGIGAAGLAADEPARAPKAGAPKSSAAKTRARKAPPAGPDIKALTREERDAQRAYERARKAAEAAEAKRKSAAEALEQAGAALGEAERRAAEAERAHRRVRRALNQARRRD